MQARNRLGPSGWICLLLAGSSCGGREIGDVGEVSSPITADESEQPRAAKYLVRQPDDARWLGRRASDARSSDTCPGELTLLRPGEDILIAGTTATATDDYTAYCGASGEGSGPDLVFPIRIAEPGTLDLVVRAAEGSNLDAVVYIRTTCEDDLTTAGCFDYSGDEQILGHYEAGLYYVIVDGDDASSGAFELAARLTPPACGDGARSPSEACDDGNRDSGDGCSARCSFEPPAGAQDVCPGETYSLGDRGHVLHGYTTGFTDDYTGSCSLRTGGRDRVYHVIPERDGIMTVEIGREIDGVSTCQVDPMGAACWDRVLYVRRSCASEDGADELACSDHLEDGTAPERVTLEVTAGTSYWVIVDGFDEAFYSWGPYRLEMSLE
jgi:cysteine-rich repeat protein